MAHRLRLEINDEFTSTASNHIVRGDLVNCGYSSDGKYIYQIITDHDYRTRVANGDNEPFVMQELGLECEYDYNYKP